MSKQISQEDKQLLLEDGWVFASEDYIFIPDDDDGCMANGVDMIRRVIDGIKSRKNTTQ